MRTIALLAIMALAAPAYSQSLEQLEELSRLNQALSGLDSLKASLNQLLKEKKLQCLTAVADETFCECITENLPVPVNFVSYVTIVTQTKEDLKYNTLSAEHKQTVDNTRRARDRCLISR